MNNDKTKPATGKWEKCNLGILEGVRCSICGFEHYGRPMGNSNYCPDCKSLMIKETAND